MFRRVGGEVKRNRMKRCRTTCDLTLPYLTLPYLTILYFTLPYLLTLAASIRVPGGGPRQASMQCWFHVFRDPMGCQVSMYPGVALSI